MGKPFQFSVRESLGAMTCLCVLAWVICLFWVPAYSHLALGLLMLFVGCCSAGAVVGEIAGYLFWGIVIGSLCFLLFLLLFSLQLLLPSAH